MKRLVLQPKKLLRFLLLGSLLGSTMVLTTGCEKETLTAERTLAVTPVATGLKGPIGLEMDANGLLWFAQQGSGANDGKVSVINAAGQVVDVLVNFPSVASPGGEPDGPSHLLFADNMLYILGTGGKMYKVPVASLKPGQGTMNASSLAVEDIGSFVIAYNFEHDTQESHPYNFTVGPNGDIYITDAAANALIRRDKNGVLSVVAEIPGLPNPTPVGPNPVESVPTGIYYDGQQFFVTTLTGFPFPNGGAAIYKVSIPASGPAVVSVYQRGFTTMVDIAKGTMASGMVVLQHGTFGAMGFAPNTGSLLWANGTSMTPIAQGLNQPAGVKQVDEHTWYVTNYGDSSIVKITN